MMSTLLALAIALLHVVVGEISPACQIQWSELTTFPPKDPALAFQVVDSFGTTTQNYGKWYQCQMTFGACVPRACNTSDVVQLAQTDAAFKFIIPLLETFNTTGATATCGDHAPESWDGGAIAMLTVLGILGSIAVIATLVDLFQRNSADGAHTTEDSDDLFERLMVESSVPKPQDEEGTAHKALLAFSLLRNWAQLVDSAPRAGRGGERFPHLDGIRFLSMTWVIFGHTIFFMLISPGIVNLVESVLPPDGASAKQWAFQLVPSAEYAVDSFFYLSGFLVGRSLLRRIREDTSVGKFLASLPLMVFLRFARLIPALAVVMFGYWSLLKYMGSGPVWYQVADGAEPCHKYWWTNLLFINTLVPWKDNFSTECMGWTWYLSVDTLLFYFVPPLVFLYTRSAKVGLAAPLALIAASITAAGVVAWHHQLSIFPFNPVGDYQDIYYTKFWFRAPPYLIGLVAALFLHSYQTKPPPVAVSLFVLAVSFVLLGWTTFGAFSMCHAHHAHHAPPDAIPLHTTAPYGVPSVNLGRYTTQQGSWNRWQNAAWVAISRPLWGLGLCLLCLVCHFGHAGPIGYLLASPIWAPLSRLTFSAYLVHEAVIEGVYFSQDHPYTYSAINAAVMTLGIGVLSYCCAALVFLFVESPFANLVKLVTPDPRKKPQ